MDKNQKLKMARYLLFQNPRDKNQKLIMERFKKIQKVTWEEEKSERSMPIRSKNESRKRFSEIS